MQGSFECTQGSLRCVKGCAESVKWSLSKESIAIDSFWCMKGSFECIQGSFRCVTGFAESVRVESIKGIYRYRSRYGVATISRMLKNICLFAEYRSLL